MEMAVGIELCLELGFVWPLEFLKIDFCFLIRTCLRWVLDGTLEKAETALYLEERKNNFITAPDFLTYKIETIHLRSFYELYRNRELCQLLQIIRSRILERGGTL